jgi:hypothetical protein
LFKESILSTTIASITNSVKKITDRISPKSLVQSFLKSSKEIPASVANDLDQSNMKELET